MTDKRKRAWLLAALVALIVVVDQVIKIMVKTHMQYGEEIPLIGEWCRLHFVENEGFAFGIALGGTVGKVLLTLFRLVASAALGWYIVHLVKKGKSGMLLISLAMILGGALGNLIDSTFYGLIFNESYYSVATLFPPNGGYAPLFYGRVVDMFYFPLFEFDWPMWMPVVGGTHFEFFDAIFNFADAAITIGTVLLLIDQIFTAPKHAKSGKKENVAEEK